MSFIRKMPAPWLERTGSVTWKAILSLQRVVLILLGMLTAGFIIASVVFRYFLNLPLMWVEELCLYLVFWYYIFGAAYATYGRSHIKGGVLSLVIKNKPRLLGSFHAGATLICLGLSCLLVVWSYYDFTWNLRLDSRTTMLFLPMAWAHLSLTVGFILMGLYFLTELIDSLRGVL